jgi:hypothetical protein
MVTMWKSRKRWPVLLALLVAFGGLAVAFACLPYGSRVTRENCERIQEGMTEAEVRAILGKPWDDSLLDPEEPNAYWAGESIVLVRPERRVEFMYGRYWMGDNIGFFVGFDDDRVVTTLLYRLEPPRSWLPQRVWRRLRARLGW